MPRPGIITRGYSSTRISPRSSARWQCSNLGWTGGSCSSTVDAHDPPEHLPLRPQSQLLAPASAYRMVELWKPQELVVPSWNGLNRASAPSTILTVLSSAPPAGHTSATTARTVPAALSATIPADAGFVRFEVHKKPESHSETHAITANEYMTEARTA